MFRIDIPILNTPNVNMHQFLNPTHAAKRTLCKTTSPRPPSEHFQIDLKTKAQGMTRMGRVHLGI